MKKSKTISIILGIVVLSALIFFSYNNNKQSSITNFEECIAAGNPAMESYPRQCMANGQTFREVIYEQRVSWKTDDIVLMQHETEGTYGCFGCSTPGEGPAMCIDPILEMKMVEETEQRYCNSDFEVVE